jgi:hypothetical protein
MQLSTTPPTSDEVRAVLERLDDVDHLLDPLSVALYLALPAAVVAPLAVQVDENLLAWRGVSLKRSGDEALDAVHLALAAQEDEDLYLVPAPHPSAWMRQRWSGTRLYLFGAEVYGKAVELSEPLEDVEVDAILALIHEGSEPPITVAPAGRTLEVSARGLRWRVDVRR